jgi:splicing factor 3B subunit 2
VSLKSYRNSVPVPAHWSQKRKYLQGKRGIEKPPWELPGKKSYTVLFAYERPIVLTSYSLFRIDFIKDTGIMEMRDAVKEKESAAGLKSKMKEKVAPKMGKLDIDYQKLHDAFFRFQTRSKYTMHGELYYEGKEFETKLKEQKPGQLSEELKEALNMPPLAPPPWLINMQRYGPPPSYPSLKISGLNAPIPEGAQWGYHPGGWGRPPVDEYNRPLYGDVFGVTQPNAAPAEYVETVDKKLWGELESEGEYEEEEESEEEEEEEEEETEEAETTEVADLADGLVTPSGMASIASGLETPDHIELRKDRVRDEDEGPKQLYQVLPELQKNITGFMGSQHGYDLTAVDKPPVNTPPGRSQTSKRKAGGENVDIAFDPSELESGLDEATLRAKYDAQMKAKKPVGTDEDDLSDMYAEHASRQAKKAKTQESRKEQKKKEFKF